MFRYNNQKLVISNGKRKQNNAKSIYGRTTFVASQMLMKLTCCLSLSDFCGVSSASGSRESGTGVGISCDIFNRS